MNFCSLFYLLNKATQWAFTCSKLTTETLPNLNDEIFCENSLRFHLSDVVLVSLLLTLNIFHTLF